MSGNLYGADIEALRRLADRIAQGSETLNGVVGVVESAMPDPGQWSGPDAESFRDEWYSTHSPALTASAQALADAAETARSNADEQDATSENLGGGGAGGIGSGVGAVGGSDRPGSVFDVLETGWAAIGAGGAAWKAFKYGRNLLNLTRALDTAGDAAAAATTFIRQGMLADGMGIVGRLGTFGRYAGIAGGAFGVIGGVNQMFNPRYDGWRGGVDRVMGGIGAVGGVATIGMFMGAAAFTGPVGIGIAVGAGLVVGAWELGNLIYDNWDAISGFVSDPLPYLADGLDAVTDFAGDAVDAVGDVASDVGDAIGDAAGAVGDFVGGLF
ncbi:hypothetical protein [Myceligenerans pegani]|uniref:WXG100 family type VII secretion target n=1 Tax=Myceligenerans pegani TaxID=2776917 RepID=A0ABR9N5D8_9MICO|nr:hypothetical protein [Myceligenerans sp. TRM 65318]MBE1878863.1 hypothetical protein [Myceligenerans sp. TRM 65318]MBE3021134.1 hypothetical protein [Myceligenerans sp. TRM 65318]